MSDDFEKPSFLYIATEEVLNNRLSGFLYAGYIKSLGLKGNEKVLDFGSGSGAGSKHIAKLLENGGSLTCVDLSEFWIEKARKRLKKYRNVEFHVGNLPDLGLEERSFDVIYISYAFHHVDKKLRKPIAEEFYRLLKDEGTVFFKEPQRENDGIPLPEVRNIMQIAGFKEARCEVKNERSVFSAVYVK